MSIRPFVLLAALSLLPCRGGCQTTRHDHAASTTPRVLQLGPRPTAPGSVVLALDRATRIDALVARIDALRRDGVQVVWFAAELPDGSEGAIGVALPAADATPTLTMRLHRERRGVPADSAIPLLQRIFDRDGGDGRRPLLLELAMPADATAQQLLETLAAVAAAGVPSVRVVASPPTGTPSADGGRTLAIDLGPAPRIQVQALAAPRAAPQLGPTPFGCLALAEVTPGPREHAASVALSDDAPRDAALAWCVAQQRRDGSLPGPDGTGDVTATAVVLSSLIASGDTLAAGPFADAVCGAAGWLCAQQDADGRIGAAPAVSVHAHALATHALAEAAMSGPRGELLRGAVRDALAWLCARRSPDGGFAEHEAAAGRSGAAPAESVVTATAIAAIAAARAAGLRAPLEGPSLAAAVAPQPGESAGPRAARLFAAHLLGVANARTVERTAAVVATAAFDDPWAAWWTTFAAFQAGDPLWTRWSDALTHELERTRQPRGPFAGTWAPAAGHTRLTTTALYAATLAARRRYERLVR